MAYVPRTAGARLVQVLGDRGRLSRSTAASRPSPAGPVGTPGEPGGVLVDPALLRHVRRARRRHAEPGRGALRDPRHGREHPGRRGRALGLRPARVPPRRRRGRHRPAALRLPRALRGLREAAAPARTRSAWPTATRPRLAAERVSIRTVSEDQRVAEQHPRAAGPLPRPGRPGGAAPGRPGRGQRGARAHQAEDGDDRGAALPGRHRAARSSPSTSSRRWPSAWPAACSGPPLGVVRAVAAAAAVRGLPARGRDASPPCPRRSPAGLVLGVWVAGHVRAAAAARRSATSRRWPSCGATSSAARRRRDPRRLAAAAGPGGERRGPRRACRPRTPAPGLVFAAAIGAALGAALGGRARCLMQALRRWFPRALALRVAAGPGQPVPARQPDGDGRPGPRLRRVPPRHACYVVQHNLLRDLRVDAAPRPAEPRPLRHPARPARAPCAALLRARGPGHGGAGAHRPHAHRVREGRERGRACWRARPSVRAAAAGSRRPGEPVDVAARVPQHVPRHARRPPSAWSRARRGRRARGASRTAAGEPVPVSLEVGVAARARRRRRRRDRLGRAGRDRAHAAWPACARWTGRASSPTSSSSSRRGRSTRRPRPS